jgi:hypothetical protein
MAFGPGDPRALAEAASQMSSLGSLGRRGPLRAKPLLPGRLLDEVAPPSVAKGSGGGKVQAGVAEHGVPPVKSAALSGLSKPASPGSVIAGAAVVAESEAKQTAELAATILRSERRGSGLKADSLHRVAAFPSREQLAAGKSFAIRGGDGIERKLLQAVGEVNGRSGVFEYILNHDGTVTHQRFIPGGQITGRPNQIVK